jgi:hypothetical protein
MAQYFIGMFEGVLKRLSDNPFQRDCAPQRCAFLLPCCAFHLSDDANLIGAHGSQIGQHRRHRMVCASRPVALLNRHVLFL